MCNSALAEKPLVQIEYEQMTVEESIMQEIKEARDRANRKEAALFALPATVRRLTREQLVKAGIHL
jgi:hypothetical protein